MFDQRVFVRVGYHATPASEKPSASHNPIKDRSRHSPETNNQPQGLNMPTVPAAPSNAASEKDPFNNNCYGTLVDRAYKLVSAAGARRRRLQRADHPRLRGRLRREGAAGRPVAGPLAGPGRHGDAARLQLHRPGDPRVHPRELHRLHGLRDRVPGHGHPRQGARRGRVGAEARRRSPRPTARCTRRSGRRPRSTTTAGKKKQGVGGMFHIIIDPSQVQGLRRVRDRVRRRRAEDDRQDRRGDDQRPQEPPLSSRTSGRRTRSTSAATCSST